MKKTALKRKNPLLKRGWSKFGNIETSYNGTLYRSRAEAHYAMFLDAEKQRGIIKDWKYETHTSLQINGKWICDVQWDFLVTFKDSHKEFHEIKGKKTDVFRLKEKIFRAIYPTTQLKIINSKDWSSR